MEKILISACLVGDKTRYDGKSNYHPIVKKLLERYELVPFCPEVEGGLKIPRPTSERVRYEVLSSSLSKDTKEHINVTKEFTLGAEKALNLCKYLNIKLAILKEDSPSCGVHRIYNGLFQNRKIPGVGVTTELLIKNNIKVLNENEVEGYLKEVTAREEEHKRIVKEKREKKLNFINKK